MRMIICSCGQYFYGNEDDECPECASGSCRYTSTLYPDEPSYEPDYDELGTVD